MCGDLHKGARGIGMHGPTRKGSSLRSSRVGTGISTCSQGGESYRGGGSALSSRLSMSSRLPSSRGGSSRAHPRGGSSRHTYALPPLATVPTPSGLRGGSRGGSSLRGGALTHRASPPAHHPVLSRLDRVERRGPQTARNYLQPQSTEPPRWQGLQMV